MDRQLFYKRFKVDGVEEMDFLDNSIHEIRIRRPLSYYRVQSVDIMRPDLIAYKVYGTVKLWWAVCLLNNITNPLKDLAVGQVLMIPNEMDLYEAQKRMGR